jgi:hypothetical protein
MTTANIQRCFVEWHGANADRFLVPIRRGAATPRSLRLDFPTLGLENNLYAALRESEITVYAAVDKEVRDLLVSLDLVVPERVAGGRVCRHCVRGVPYTGITAALYESFEALWVDRLLKDFLDWVNAKLAHADALAFYHFGAGMTSAHLLPVDCGRVRDVAPAHNFPPGPWRGGLWPEARHRRRFAESTARGTNQGRSSLPTAARAAAAGSGWPRRDRCG